MNHSWIIPMNYLWIFLPICTQRNAINCDPLLFIVKLKLTSLTLSFNFLYVLNWSRGERGSSSLLLTLLFPEIQFLISLLEKKCTKKHCNGGAFVHLLQEQVDLDTLIFTGISKTSSLLGSFDGSFTPVSFFFQEYGLFFSVFSLPISIHKHLVTSGHFLTFLFNLKNKDFDHVHEIKHQILIKKLKMQSCMKVA